MSDGKLLEALRQELAVLENSRAQQFTGWQAVQASLKRIMAVLEAESEEEADA